MIFLTINVLNKTFANHNDKNKEKPNQLIYHSCICDNYVTVYFKDIQEWIKCQIKNYLKMENNHLLCNN